MANDPIQITRNDLERLKKVLEETRRTATLDSDSLADLEAELERAEVVDSTAVPPDVVTMNSTVTLLDLESGEEETYTLVFPENAAGRGRISVVAPIGTAMLGYRVGDVFEWEVPAGKRRLQVKQVHYQPEAAGDHHA